MTKRQTTQHEFVGIQMRVRFTESPIDQLRGKRFPDSLLFFRQLSRKYVVSREFILTQSWDIGHYLGSGPHSAFMFAVITHLNAKIFNPSPKVAIKI
jgi:hypothetical protein